MKKLLLSILVGIALIGCGSKEAETSNKIVMWGGVPYEKGPKAIVEEWNANNPDTPVEYVRYVNNDQGNTKLDTALMSGEEIDLFFSYEPYNLIKRINGGTVEPLNNLGAESFIKENINEDLNSVSTVIISDKIYGVPAGMHIEGIAYNEDILNNLNYKPTKDWTVEEFIDIAAKISDPSKNLYGTTVSTVPTETFDSLYAQSFYGGDYFYKNSKESNFNSEIFKEDISMRLIKSKGAIPYEDVLVRNSWAYPQLLTKEIAMVTFSPWMLRDFRDLENYPRDFKISFLPFPNIEGKETPYTAQYKNIISINSKSNNKDASWKFLQFWVTEGYKSMMKFGKLPSYKNVDKDEALNSLVGDLSDDLLDKKALKNFLFNTDNKKFVVKEYNKRNEIITLKKNLFDMYYLGEIDQKTMLSDLKSQADKLLKEE